MNIYVNDAYLPYMDDDTRTQIFYGGSSSGKSFFLAQRTITDVMRGRNFLIVRNVQSSIKRSVFNQILKTIVDMGVSSKFEINKSDMIITCKKNGKQIFFAGLDDVEKLKSVTPVNGVITDIWLEEATEVNEADYRQLKKRLRGKTENGMKKRIMFSFNPILQDHWIYKEFFGGWDESKTLYRDPQLMILKTTYKDNMFLEPDDIYDLENETDRYFYEVYTLGNWGILGKVIFRNWRTEDLSGIRDTFDNIYNGLDFGFAEDPSALVCCHVDMKRKKIYIFDELYHGGLHIDELSTLVEKKIHKQYVTCDCSEPRSISEMNRNGIRALAAKKGADSILHGIQWLQQFEIIVDIRCQNMKNELQCYHWAEDKYGNTLRRPVDKDNHLIDALRYATESLQIQSGIRPSRRLI